MARTGRFGRLPRVAGNLTSVIVSLAREMANQQDQNIVKAWKDGGDFNGKPVTDEMLLQHLTDRRDSVAKNDPLFDYYDNLVQTYGFSIEESKMTLKWANHAVSDGAMVNFYKTWASKLPTDSEAYRTLMRSAAQYLDYAKQRGAAGSAAARQAAYQASFDAQYKKNEKPFDDASGILTQAAIRAGILSRKSNGDYETLADLRGGMQQDQARFLSLFDEIAQSPQYADVRAELTAAGMDHLDYGTWLDLSTHKQAGLQARIDLAVQYKDKSGEKTARSDLASFTEQRLVWGDIPVQAAYAKARQDWEQRFTDPTLSPFEVLALTDTYRRSLTTMLGQSLSEGDRGDINNELLALDGKATSVGAGQGANPDVPVSDAILTSNSINQIRAITDAVLAGNGVLSTEPRVDQATGSTYQAYVYVASQDARLHDPKAGAVIWTDVGGGIVKPVWVAFHPIYSEAGGAVDPITGSVTTTLKPNAGQDPQVGVYYVLDGKTFYGVNGGTGTGGMQWFSDNPFAAPGGGHLGSAVDKDGALHLQWAMATDASRPSNQQGSTYNVRDVIPAAAMDPGSQYTHRFADPSDAFYLSSPDARKALLQMSPYEVAQTLLGLNNGDEIAASTAMDAFNAKRDTAAMLENRAISLTGMAAAQSGMQQYQVSRRVPYDSPLYAAHGLNPLQEVLGQGTAGPSDRFGTGEERMLTPAGQVMGEEAAMRQRAAVLVAQSRLAAGNPTTLYGRGFAVGVNATMRADAYQSLLEQAQKEVSGLSTTTGGLQSYVNQRVPGNQQTFSTLGAPLAAIPGQSPVGVQPVIRTPTIQPIMPPQTSALNYWGKANDLIQSEAPGGILTPTVKTPTFNPYLGSGKAAGLPTG